jgi:hypothetical protein
MNRGTGSNVYLLQGLSLRLLSLLLLSNIKDKLQVLWRRLGHGSAKSRFLQLLLAHC